MDVGNQMIGTVGEKKFLDKVFDILGGNDKNFLNGLNQDSSILKINHNTLLATNIDKAQTPIILSDDDLNTYKAWGYLSVTSSLSDILVVGAKGLSFLISITVPANIQTQKVLNIIEGAQEACKYYGISFLGGDTKKGNEISVVGTANGIITGSDYLSRNSSHPSDLIVCTGQFGQFATSYYKILKSLELELHETNYVSYPRFAIDQCEVVNSNLSLFSASMDNSDGLSNILSKMFIENNLGFEIYLDSIPFSEKSRELSKSHNIPLENFAFYVGDWNSIFTISEENFKILGKRVENHELKVIGKVKKSSNIKEFHKNTKRYSCSLRFENDSFISSTGDTNYLLNNILTTASVLI